MYIHKAACNRAFSSLVESLSIYNYTTQKQTPSRVRLYTCARVYANGAYMVTRGDNGSSLTSRRVFFHRKWKGVYERDERRASSSLCVTRDFAPRAVGVTDEYSEILP